MLALTLVLGICIQCICKYPDFFTGWRDVKQIFLRSWPHQYSLILQKWLMIIPLSIYNEDMYHDVISAISFQAVALIRSQFKSASGHGNRNSFNMN